MGPVGNPRGKHRLTANERAALLKVACGAKSQNHGRVVICDYPVNHLGKHRGES